MVKTCASVQGLWVQSLFRELRSYMLCGQKKISVLIFNLKLRLMIYQGLVMRTKKGNEIKTVIRSYNLTPQNNFIKVN